MRDVWLAILRRYALLFVALLLVIADDIAVNVTPPLVLQYLVDHLADGTIAEETLLLAALLYFALCAAGGLVDTLKETGITVLGQKITHGLRSAMYQRRTRHPARHRSATALPADALLPAAHAPSPARQPRSHRKDERPDS